MNKCFTLIELLVVVLIIGILAAIALPQYTKAVERSRMSEAVQTLGDLATAQSIYYMQHNRFATGFTGENSIASGDMTIADPSANGRWTYTVTGGTDNGTMTAQRTGGMYNGGSLQLVVDPDGEIHKTCTNPANTTEFCSMAETAGYTTAAAAAGGDDDGD